MSMASAAERRLRLAFKDRSGVERIASTKVSTVEERFNLNSDHGILTSGMAGATPAMDPHCKNVCLVSAVQEAEPRPEPRKS